MYVCAFIFFIHSPRAFVSVLILYLTPPPKTTTPFPSRLFPLFLQLYSLMMSSRRSCDCPCKTPSSRHQKTHSSSLMMIVAETSAMHVHTQPASHTTAKNSARTFLRKYCASLGSSFYLSVRIPVLPRVHRSKSGSNTSPSESEPSSRGPRGA